MKAPGRRPGRWAGRARRATAAADRSQQPSGLTTPTRRRQARPAGPDRHRNFPRPHASHRTSTGPAAHLPRTGHAAPPAAGGPARPAGRLPGDDTGGATPVPIPNTAVKPAGPMIVPQARKSVIAGVIFLNARAPTSPSGVVGVFALTEYLRIVNLMISAP